MTATERAGLTAGERTTLAAALDALLPPTGSFPLPSETEMIDEFILGQLSPPNAVTMYPGINLEGLRETLAALAEQPNVTAALHTFERDHPERFQALWALAVYGYYSRPEVTAAIQRDLAQGYHGAPLPLGYAHVITPWDRDDPLQMPREPRGRYIATEDVRRVDLSRLEGGGR